MKFNCGKSLRERWHARLFEKKLRLIQVHRVFAWRPVRVSATECIWLEYVERWYTHVDVFEYGALFFPELVRGRPHYRKVQ